MSEQEGEIGEILEFLTEWRTRKELQERFTLSNTRSYNLINWLLKGKYISRIKGTYGHTKSTNKLYLYKRV